LKKISIDKLKRNVTRWAIGLALRRPAPAIIPLSNIDKLKERDYYTVSLLDDRDGVQVGISSLDQNGVEGFWSIRRESSEGRPVCIPENEIEKFQIELVHYANELEIRYGTAFEFLLGKYTFLAARAIWRHRLKVWAFSKRKLPRQDRREVLSLAYEWTITNENNEFEFGPQTFLIRKYGILIALHPEFRQQYRYYRLILESLVESGDMKKNNGTYNLLPKALASLHEYEESDRRHQDQLRQQRILGWLTFALVVVGVFQITANIFGN
jgi:hypothetical protein